MTKRTFVLLLALLCSSVPALSQTLYQVGDVWQAPGKPAFQEDFKQGFRGRTGNTTNWLYDLRPLSASPSGQQVYDGMLDGTSTFGLKANCVGAWDATQPTQVPSVSGTAPCLTVTASFNNGAWHSGVIATTQPDGSPIAANPAISLGNRWAVQILARMPDAVTGTVPTGLTPALWANDVSNAGSCTNEFDILEYGSPYYHTMSSHCWQNGSDQHTVSLAVQDLFAVNGNVTTSDITNWHWWGFQRTGLQNIWTRDGVVTMVSPQDPANKDSAFDLMISLDQIGCCGWSPIADTTLRPQGWLAGFAIWQ